jgi:ketosteroid isomerase-like protein
MDDAAVADELAIRNLVARYADAVTRRDEAAWTATWAKDGEWWMMGSPTRGREDVVALWRTLTGPLAFVIQIPTTGLIELRGDCAVGRWYITEHIRGGDGSAMLILGVYHDRYRREDGEWVFETRRFDPLYMGPPDLSAEARPFPEQAAKENES